MFASSFYRQNPQYTVHFLYITSDALKHTVHTIEKFGVGQRLLCSPAFI